MADKTGPQAARETFRQFAWNLAGTLAAAPRRGEKPARPRPAKRPGPR